MSHRFLNQRYQYTLIYGTWQEIAAQYLLPPFVDQGDGLVLWRVLTVSTDAIHSLSSFVFENQDRYWEAEYRFRNFTNGEGSD